MGLGPALRRAPLALGALARVVLIAYASVQDAVAEVTEHFRLNYFSFTYTCELIYFVMYVNERTLMYPMYMSVNGST